MSGTILNREELDKLERRELQLTVLSVVFVLVLAGGLASFMYPLVFVHPEGGKWTMRVAFFGFCALTMLFVSYLIRAKTMQKTLSLVLLKVNKGAKNPDMTAVCSATAKALSRRLRPTDSIFRLSPEVFSAVLPETDATNGKRVAARLQEELQSARAPFGVALTSTCITENVVSAHEMEDLVKSLLPEQQGWEATVPALAD